MNFEGAEYKLIFFRDPLFSPFFAPPIETALLPTFLRLRVCRSSRRHTARSLHMEKVQGSKCHHHACALLHALFWGGKAHRGEDWRGDRPFAPPLPPPLTCSLDKANVQFYKVLNQRVAWASIQIYGARGTMEFQWRFFRISTEISFHKRFQRRFLDFAKGLQISREISDKVYEISVSGGPPEAGSILGNM